jgi:hypothetical protein
MLTTTPTKRRRNAFFVSVIWFWNGYH